MDNLNKLLDHYSDSTKSIDDIKRLMIEYAKQMCDIQRVICYTNAECTNNFFEIDMWSIINAPYPDELQ